MKAPLRYLFGWVIFVAIYAAIVPVCNVINTAVRQMPLAVPIAAAIVALCVMAACFFIVLRPFWRWCDEPRAKARISTLEEKPCSY